MADPPPTPDEFAAAAAVLRRLADRPGPWPTSDPTLAELVKAAEGLKK